MHFISLDIVQPAEHHPKGIAIKNNPPEGKTYYITIN